MFMKAAKNVLSMRIRDFIEKYSDLLPPYGIITEDESVEKVLDMVKEGKHYIIVVDKRGRVRGIVTYLDLLLALGGPPKAVAAFMPLASMASSLRKIKLSSEVLPKVLVKRIMERHPHHVKLTNTVEDAIDAMSRDHTYHAVIVDEKGRAKGVLTAHAIFRAVIKEARAESE